MNTLTQTTAQLPNPYSLMAPLPAPQVGFLLMLAVACLVAGLLLAEQTVLRRVIEVLEREFDFNLSGAKRRVGETL